VFKSFGGGGKKQLQDLSNSKGKRNAALAGEKQRLGKIGTWQSAGSRPRGLGMLPRNTERSGRANVDIQKTRRKKWKNQADEKGKGSIGETEWSVGRPLASGGRRELPQLCERGQSKAYEREFVKVGERLSFSLIGSPSRPVQEDEGEAD